MSLRFSELDGASVGVWGAGREISSFAGQLARHLPLARIVVVALDSDTGEDVRARLRIPSARLVAGAEVTAALADCDVVVRSPGVSIHRPELRELRKAGIPITTATALWLAERDGSRVIGVTGTKGKSTTATLLAHLARASGHTVALAGNIGVPALELLDRPATEWAVLELSSYQIADMETGPEVAVITNLFREHIDWHGSEEVYKADKLRLLGLPGVRVAVVNARDERLVRAVHADAVTRLYGLAGGWNAGPGGVMLRGELIATAGELPLRGEHNALNLCGALTALEAIGIDPPPLSRSLKDFQGLPHRLQTIVERDGVTWVDDSISTTPESALAALRSFTGRDIVLLAGGQDRQQDYGELGIRLVELKATVVGLPSTGSRIVAATRQAGAPDSRAVEAGDLAEAVALARQRVTPGSVVLLSPAAPSYDHYRNFEARGALFHTLAAQHA
ncbi:MAG TPA: UDP-N-acetylmuramoyl-L-alanine--D-glutamate ligase [Solirubrobacteraceae bacterium]